MLSRTVVQLRVTHNGVLRGSATLALPLRMARAQAALGTIGGVIRGSGLAGTDALKMATALLTSVAQGVVTDRPPALTLDMPHTRLDPMVRPAVVRALEAVPDLRGYAPLMAGRSPCSAHFTPDEIEIGGVPMLLSVSSGAPRAAAPDLDVYLPAVIDAALDGYRLTLLGAYAHGGEVQYVTRLTALNLPGCVCDGVAVAETLGGQFLASPDFDAEDNARLEPGWSLAAVMAVICMDARPHLHVMPQVPAARSAALGCGQAAPHASRREGTARQRPSP